MALLRIASNDNWDREPFMSLYDVVLVEAILCKEWPKVHCPNKLMWTRKGSRKFFAKEAYKVLLETKLSDSLSPLLGSLWKPWLHERLRMHLWRTLA